MTFPKLVLAALVCFAGPLGCSTDYVVYQGTVTEGSADGYEFTRVNEHAGTPIVNAKVIACAGDECGDAVYTDSNGRFPEVTAEIVAITDAPATVTVTTADGRTFRYETTLKNPTDPIYGPDQDRGPAGYLHIQLAP